MQGLGFRISVFKFNESIMVSFNDMGIMGGWDDFRS